MHLHRPIFLLSPPRAGSTLLTETLAASPDVWTILTEAHSVFESVPGLHPRDRGWDSNRLTAADATPAVVDRLSYKFRLRMRDRDGRRGRNVPDAVLLEKTPKNSLRVPFLAAAFPDARFVYLHREPVETISSMLDGWQVPDKFISYPDLPGWQGLPWSFLLVPGWRDLIGRPLAEVAVAQWQRTVDILLADLALLPSERWIVSDFARLTGDPAGEIGRLCALLGLTYDRPLSAPLRPSKSVNTPPAEQKWRRNAPLLEPLLPLVRPAAERTRSLVTLRS